MNRYLISLYILKIFREYYVGSADLDSFFRCATFPSYRGGGEEKGQFLNGSPRGRMHLLNARIAVAIKL